MKKTFNLLVKILIAIVVVLFILGSSYEAANYNGYKRWSKVLKNNQDNLGWQIKFNDKLDRQTVNKNTVVFLDENYDIINKNNYRLELLDDLKTLNFIYNGSTKKMI